MSGFASQVRIGVHLDEATRDAAANYDGCGGHVAARVGAEAGAREILAGCETLDAAGPDFVRDGLRMVARKRSEAADRAAEHPVGLIVD